MILAAGMLHLGAHADPVSRYPEKPINIIVNFPAGGTIDVHARIIGQKLTEKWGQPVVVQNLLGAGGNIGAAAAYAAAGDGYTLLATPPGPLSINQYLYKSLGFVPERFVPVTLMTMIPNVVTVRAGLPVKTLRELIAYAKANPGKVTFASQGSGSTSHLAAQMLANMAGLELVHVPYKGQGPALIDLAADRVDLMISNVPSVTKYQEMGKARMLAVAGPNRSSAAPEVPTAAEAGLPGFENTAWFSLVAAPGTPMPIAEKLSSAIRDIMRQPDVQARFQAFGGEVVGNTPKEFGDFIARERVMWKAVIDSAAIGMD